MRLIDFLNYFNVSILDFLKLPEGIQHETIIGLFLSNKYNPGNFLYVPPTWMAKNTKRYQNLFTSENRHLFKPSDNPVNDQVDPEVNGVDELLSLWISEFPEIDAANVISRKWLEYNYRPGGPKFKIAQKTWSNYFGTNETRYLKRLIK